MSGSVHLLALPTPFQIGAVNCYALEGEPLTLIDVGPHTDEALKTLTSQLERLGHRLQDVEQLLITHPHLDHFGLAAAVKEASGCEVVAHPQAGVKLANFRGYYEREQGYFTDILVSMGMPLQSARLITQLPQSFSVLAPHVQADRCLSEGDTVRAGDLTLQVLETPGHSMASLCFYVADQEILFAGDHLIDGITPNPLLEMPEAPGEERPRTLAQYLDSLNKVAKLKLQVVYSGHRSVIHDPQRVIELTLKHHHHRSAKVFKLITEKPLTPYELMGKLFPNLPATEQFLGMSEAIGHLEWLQDQGSVRALDQGGVVYFEVV